MSYTPAQRGAIQQLTAFTSCSERTAVKFLKAHKWNVEVAADSFFSSGAAANEPAPSAAPRANITDKLNEIFNSYRDASDPPDKIETNGAIKYFGDIGIDLEDVSVFVLGEFLKAPTMGEFLRSGFVEGWRSRNADTVPKQAEEARKLRNQFVTDNEVFKRVYTYTFGFALTAPAKTLPLEVAVLGWKCLFHEQHPFHAYLGYWVEFLETEYKKAISKDTWNMLLEFATWLQGEGDKGVKEYDIYGAWPSIIDSFVEFINKKQGNDRMEESDDWNY